MKLLSSDMDGTIIEHQSVRSSQDAQMLHRLREAGHLIAFNTGRNEQEAKAVVDAHNFIYDYLILNNGGHIVDQYGNTLFKKVIPYEIGKDIIELCIKSGVHVFFYTGERTLGFHKGVTYLHTGMGQSILEDVDFVEEYSKGNDFYIIACHQDNNEVDLLTEIQNQVKAMYGEFANGCLNTCYLDITPIGCTKGTGVDVINQLHNNTLVTYGVGDSFNDIDMFKHVDHAFTFHGVDDQIKLHASHQVEYVYEVIEKILGE